LSVLLRVPAIDLYLFSLLGFNPYRRRLSDLDVIGDVACWRVVRELSTIPLDVDGLRLGRAGDVSLWLECCRGRFVPSGPRGLGALVGQWVRSVVGGRCVFVR